MLFISYKHSKRSDPKRVLTAEKFVRSLKLILSQRRRAVKIQNKYQDTVDAKGLMLKMTLSNQKINELKAVKASERKAGHGKKLHLAYLKNATSYFLFLQGLLDFARAEKAPRAFIEVIERKVDLAQEKMIGIRETKF